MKRITFTIEKLPQETSGFLSLKVYDESENEVDTFLMKKSARDYAAEFSIAGLYTHLPGEIYYYNLSGGYSFNQ